MRHAKGNHHLKTITSLMVLLGSAILCSGVGRPQTIGASYQKPEDKIPGHAQGPQVIAALGSKVPEVARIWGMTEQEFRDLVNHDHSIHADEEGEIYYVCEGLTVNEAAGIDATTSSFAGTSSGDAFNLSSFPGSPLTIHLDFDGHVTRGTSWNSRVGGADIVTPAYDTDGNSSSFSSGELSNIIAIWKRVAEDFAPWQVNVTTVDPGEEALKKSSTNDSVYGIRVVIGGSSYDWYGKGAGGVAYIGSFSWNTDTPCYVFEDQLGNGNVKYTAEAASHEAGHTFSLRHDGSSTTSYYQGHDDWAPIMGVGYYKNIVQWSKGEYPDANNTEDDIAKIASYVPFRQDTAGDDIQTQATLGLNAIIETVEADADTDVYVFQTDGGLVDLSAQAVSAGNLDIQLALYDNRGDLVSYSSPGSSLSASLSANLPAGTYYASVEGVPGTGYSGYGSIGQYRLAANFATSQNQAPVAVASTDSPTTGLAPLSVTFSSSGSYDSDGSIVSYDWAFGDGGSSSLQSPSHIYNTPGSYTATLVVIDDKGASSSASIEINVTEPLPPIADASQSSPVSGRAPLTVNLDGNASYDPDGTITSYSWSGSNGATSSGSTCNMTFNTAGTYTVNLQVIDSDGYADTDSITITVNDPLPPVADASRSSSTSGYAPLTVNLDGTASYDPDGSLTSYSWSASNGDLASGSKASMTFNSAGTYTVTLEVIDDEGMTDTDTLTVTVADAPQLPSIYVDSIKVFVDGNNKKGYTATAEVMIVDANGQPVHGAVVYASFSGQVNEDVSSNTRKWGDANFRSSKFDVDGPVSLTVTDVVLDGYQFVP